jgi:hypothetical protein
MGPWDRQFFGVIGFFCCSLVLQSNGTMELTIFLGVYDSLCYTVVVYTSYGTMGPAFFLRDFCLAPFYFLQSCGTMGQAFFKGIFF